MLSVEVSRQTKPRVLPGRFFGPNGLRKTPMRPMPIVADEKDVVDRIRAATTTRDEPEVICDDAILDDWASVALLHQSQQHEHDVALAKMLRPMLSVRDRIADIERRSRYAHVDLSNEIHIMRRDVDRADAGGRRPPARVIARCEALELLLDGVAA